MFEKIRIFMDFRFYKTVSHFLLFWVSMLFSVMLFMSFTDNLFIKAIWIVMAVALELLKTFLIKEIKAIYKKLVIIVLVILYVVIAGISGIATYGSVKLTLDAQEVRAEKLNLSSENIEFAIAQIDLKMDRLNRASASAVSEKEKMNESEGIYYTGLSKMTDDMKLAEAEMEALLEERTTLVNSLREEAENTANVSKDVFSLIGEDIGLSGRDTLFYIFVVLIIVLEIALFATTDKFDVEEIKEESEYEMVCRYIDAMEKENSSVLNSDEKISEMTGISKKNCKRYRELLKTLKHRGKSLIHVNGTSRANFNSSTMKKIVKNYYEMEDNNE